MAEVENYQTEFIPKCEALLENEDFTPVKVYHPDYIRDTYQMGLDDPKQQTKAVASIKTLVNEHYKEYNVFRTRGVVSKLNAESQETSNEIRSTLIDGISELTADLLDVVFSSIKPRSSEKNPDPRFESVAELVENKFMNNIEKHLIEVQESS